MSILLLLISLLQNPCDLNYDLMVNERDLEVLKEDWNTDNPRSDINRDGIVDIKDLSILAKNL